MPENYIQPGMIGPIIEAAIRDILSHAINGKIVSFRTYPVGGGSINNSYQVIINDRSKFFCKINVADKFPGLFEKEKNGLQLLGTHKIIRVPKVIASHTAGNYQLLILEWIEQGLKTEKCWAALGEQLSRLHFISNGQFGLHEDNYMGALPQLNRQSDDWVDFLISQRFMPQVKLGIEKKLLEKNHAAMFENLYKKLDDIFPVEEPALLHGDLWSGNFFCDEGHDPVLIDPAVYFGHRSMDLAMTKLFGGFDTKFYESYHYHYPFPYNHDEQWEVCNLYPLLIHLNLFGKGYLHDIIHTIRHY